MNKPSYYELAKKRTIESKGGEELKLEKGGYRYWIHKNPKQKKLGYPFNFTVSVQKLKDGKWKSHSMYNGGKPKESILKKLLGTKTETVHLRD
jgi:hypothetical protein